MRVFFLAGEASGDAYAAALATRLPPDFELEGIGGNRLRATGARLVADSSHWGAIGVLQSLGLISRVARGFFCARRHLKRGTPGVFVPIDYGFINTKLARIARAAGWRVIYFLPPGSWKRDRQGKDLPMITDEIVTQFPWSYDILKGMGARVHFFGHPILQLIQEADLSQGRDSDTVAVLPGSRKHEVESNLVVIVETVRRMGLRKLVFGVAPSIGTNRMRELWLATNPPDAEVEFREGLYPMLSSARAGIVCSGTATLEAALCGLPHVVIYRGTPLMEWEHKIRKPKYEFISLPNILLRQKVLPELVLSAASAENIERELRPLMTDGPERQEQLEAFSQLSRLLEPPEALTRTAELIVETGRALEKSKEER